MASATSFHYKVNCKIPGCTETHIDDMDPSKVNDSFRAVRKLLDTIKARELKTTIETHDKPISAIASFPTSAQVIECNVTNIIKQEKKLMTPPKKHIDRIPSPLIKAESPKYKPINIDDIVEKLSGYYNVSEQLFNTKYPDKANIITTLKKDLADINSKFEAVANIIGK